MLEVLFLNVARQLQLRRGDEHEFDVLVAGHRGDKRVYRAPELQVAAQPDGERVEPAQLALDGKEVGERLRRVEVSAVAGVDDRHIRAHGRHERGAFFWMAHGNDVGVAAHHGDGV